MFYNYLTKEYVATVMRNIMMTIFLMAAIAGASICAMAADDEKKSSSGPTASKQARPAKKASNKSAGPAAVFKPSEKIGADSAVSFPVDI
jgi:hypothetical protein